MQQLSFFTPPPPVRRPTLFGYELSAFNSDTGNICTYRMAPTQEIALEYCKEEFPIEENYINHETKEVD